MSIILLRKYHKEKILINPFSLSGNLYSLIDDIGGSKEDKTAVPTPVSYTNPVRISFETKWIQKRNDTNTPVAVQRRVYYMISDYETKVDVRLEFEYTGGITLKVMQRKQLRKFSGLIGYEYELKNLTEGNYYGG